MKPNAREGITGRLKAWDPVARKVVWETEALAMDGRSGRPTGGALATAGNLVFMGIGQGKELRAYDAKSARSSGASPTQTMTFAAPITYELDGVQYVAASVGGASQGNYFAPSYGRMLVFRWAARRVARAAAYTPPPLNPPASTASADVVKAGEEKYSQYCSVCIGAGGLQGRSSFPNLTVTPFLHSQEGFDQVVLQGVRGRQGHGFVRAVPQACGYGRDPGVPGLACHCIEGRAATGGTRARAGHAPASHQIAAGHKSCTLRVHLPRAVFARGTRSVRQVACFPAPRCWTKRRPVLDSPPLQDRPPAFL